jgi:hypothetical protein
MQRIKAILSQVPAESATADWAEATMPIRPIII